MNLLSGLILSLALSACGDEAESDAVAPSPALPAPDIKLAACHDGANLRLQLAGAISGTFEWQDNEFQCESMRRPDDAGARLRFVADVEESPLSLIVAIPDLQRGTAASELASNLTLYVEGEALFFGTQGTDSCWADIVSQDPVGDARYDIAGDVYCISPLSEINGSSSVTIVELEFKSRLDWDVT